MGYANRLIRLDFPDLSEEGDPIFVTIRNPKLVPPDTLIVSNLIDRGDDAPITTEEAIAGNATVASRLIVAWHVYDGTDASDDAKPLPLPATPELVRLLPPDITRRILGQIPGKKAEKQDPEKQDPETTAPEASTSTTS